MAFKKNQFPQDDVRKKVQQPGVYILMSANDGSSVKRKAYVGESENVRGRLETHWRSKEKEFWEDTIVLASKDENLTKSHVRYAEERLIKTHQNPGWERKKQNQPSSEAGQLPLPDRCDMDRFVNEAKMLVGVLGCDLFRGGECEEPNEITAAGQETQETFCLKYPQGSMDAKMRISDSGFFVVQKGSKARFEKKVLQEGYKKLHSNLLEEDFLEERDGCYVFAKSYAFESISAAASVVANGNQNGRTAWKLCGSKTTYAEWEATKIKSDTADGNNAP